MSEVEQVYQDFWRFIIEKKDGSMNLDQLKLELYDYYQAIQNVTKVYEEITAGRFTKLNTDPQHIIDAAEERYRNLYETYDVGW